MVAHVSQHLIARHELVLAVLGLIESQARDVVIRERRAQHDRDICAAVSDSIARSKLTPYVIGDRTSGAILDRWLCTLGPGGSRSHQHTGTARDVASSISRVRGARTTGTSSGPRYRTLAARDRAAARAWRCDVPSRMVARLLSSCHQRTTSRAVARRIAYREARSHPRVGTADRCKPWRRCSVSDRGAIGQIGWDGLLVGTLTRQSSAWP